MLMNSDVIFLKKQYYLSADIFHQLTLELSAKMYLPLRQNQENLTSNKTVDFYMQ